VTRLVPPAVVALLAALLLGAALGGSTPGSPGLAPPALDAEVARRGSALVARNNRIWTSDEAGQFHEAARAGDGGAVQDPAWHPDGQRFAYTVFPPAPTPVPGVGQPRIGVSEIWQANRGGAAHPIARPDGDEVRLGQTAWQADGSAIYYTRGEIVRRGGEIAGQRRRVERLALATQERTILADPGASPAVSPDGRLLAYVDASGDAPALWLIDLTTGQRRRATDGRFADVVNPSFSPDGRTIAFGGAPRMGASADRVPDATDRLVRWLAPRAYAHGPPFTIWLLHPSNLALDQLGDFVFDGPSPRWLDATALLVQDELALYRVDLRSLGRTTLNQAEGVTGFDWAPRR